ncbi:MAG TPA: methyltransferase [Bacteroidota bacterium]|nr:methyltransferase [Bacteroidota bacterium]
MPPSYSLVEKLLHRFHLLPSPVLDAFGAVVFARALTVGLRRGLFESLVRRPLSLDELSGETGLTRGGVQLLADACVAGGYLRCRGGIYSATPETRKWLARSSKTYLGDLICYFDSLNARLGGLEYALEHGKPREPYYASFTEEDWGTYVRGMANLARLLIPEVIRRIKIPGSGGRILDLGGSHGLYSAECCRRSAGCNALVMDFAPALQWGAAMHEADPAGRVIFSSGDILTAEFPPGQDAVFMFNILHGFDEETNRSLIARASRALREGGRLYILDQMTGTGRRSPLSQFIPLMVGLNLMNEIGGSAHSVARVRSWCAHAAMFRVMPLRFPGVTLIEAAGWNIPAGNASHGT